MAKVTITIEDIGNGVEMKVLPGGVTRIVQRMKDGADVSDAEYYTVKLARIFRDIVKIEQHNAQAKSPIILPKKISL